MWERVCVALRLADNPSFWCGPKNGGMKNRLLAEMTEKHAFQLVPQIDEHLIGALLQCPKKKAVTKIASIAFGGILWPLFFSLSKAENKSPTTASQKQCLSRWLLVFRCQKAFRNSLSRPALSFQCLVNVAPMEQPHESG